jgi:hypothetical protein
MNKINLHIIGSKVFYDLLNEQNFDYNIHLDNNLKYKNYDDCVRAVFLEELELFEVKKFFLNNVPTIFFSKSKDFLTKNKLILLDFHVSLLVPIEILTFKEILNILITKYNFFKKSKIIVNDYEIDSNQRLITKNKVKAKLTEKELELILALNNNQGLNKSFLLRTIWNHGSDLESHAFETHLHRLRKKMSKTFNDNKFIVEKKSLYYLS